MNTFTLAPEVMDSLKSEGVDVVSYHMGAIEGSMIFSLCADQGRPSETINNCKRHLLLRLGLEGNALTLEQQRLRGWIVGLMESAIEALDPETEAEPA
ncbi:hypothetical protein [Chromobacterium amazonense]|uniref:hypothetical protein n=1 Tax=Chromobacterium amazonense TaxID=1382803 RepID=UPI003F79C208